MPDTWFISDHHLQHSKVLTFTNSLGGLIRPEFSNVDEMDEVIISEHNEVVDDDDTVYFLGDVVWKYNPDTLDKLHRMKGNKRLLLGNHDRGMQLVPYFDRISLWKSFYVNDVHIVASHVPLVGDDLSRCSLNVHGHTHEKYMLNADGTDSEKHFNVCVETLGYSPIHIEDILQLSGV